MSEINLIFPHQLFQDHPLADNGHPTLLVEEHLFFGQYAFHKQKIAFHRATMQRFAGHWQHAGRGITYIEAHEARADIRKLLPQLAKEGVRKVHYIDPTDDWLERRLQAGIADGGMNAQVYPSPLFLNQREELADFFRSNKKKYFQTTFYKSERIKRNLFVDAEGAPEGGKWTFDTENRKKYPKKKTPPAVQFPDSDAIFESACAYVEAHFGDNPGHLKPYPLYPDSWEGSAQWLDNFLHERFHDFGAYEDAIVASESILNHSVLTPMLNVGLLQPQQILDAVHAHLEEHEIPFNSVEGFVRQIVGWREFIRGVYGAKGREERTRNFWGFTRKIPPSFYNGTTGIPPVDITIRKVLDTGYCHHIERLMVLGNFMVLCEFDPDEVYRWFMELFIDAYDWVMVPNVYGMSQFADGGLMSTKPYISGSNYLIKMSDYGKGEWQATWDALFWRFMHVNRDFMKKNPRLAMLVGNFDKMAETKRKELLERAEDFLAGLES